MLNDFAAADLDQVGAVENSSRYELIDNIRLNEN